MVPIHPGRILRRELAARAMSANRLALALRVPSGRITSILNGKRAISADTALRLARHLGPSARFWLNLQTRYDLAVAERDHGARIAAEVPAPRERSAAVGIGFFLPFGAAHSGDTCCPTKCTSNR
jgi:antitoxin HigA-1